MRWEDMAGSSNVEDRRGQGGRRMGGGIPIRGVGGVVVFLLVIVAGYYGIDLTPLVADGNTSITAPGDYTPSETDQEMARFSSVALKSTEDVWTEQFRKMGQTYSPPKMVLFTGVTDTACGYGQSAMGPFYCPNDQTVYLDTSFFHDMQQRMGGGGDFAQGYVIAHEVGHHVQHLLGIGQQIQRLQQRLPQRQANQLSVRIELQADCYAGVWGRAMQERGVLDPGDIEEALRTAQAIGDDRLQRQTTGRVVPDSFTHGSSAQRLEWFRRGFESGDPKACNTFSDLE